MVRQKHYRGSGHAPVPSTWSWPTSAADALPLQPPQKSDLFLQLPEELINHILTFVQHFRDVSALHETCKRLQRITVPHLYSNITVSRYRRNDPCAVYLTSYTLRKFAKHMMTHPELASLVKNLTFATPISSTHLGEAGMSDNGGSRPTFLEDDKVLMAAVELCLTDESEAKRWKSALHVVWSGSGDLNDDVVLALLLNLCRLFMQMTSHAPHLAAILDRVAESSYPFTSSNTSESGIGLVKPPAGGFARSFRNLRHLASAHYEYHRGVRPTYFARFLRLPSIQRIQTKFLATNSGPMSIPSIDPDMAKIPAQSSCTNISKW